ncbi:MAG: response regulator [Candidatus Omnitrophica bacterium]|nr:response regulator [Candidatus Omnitrophota bacterium]
MVKKKILIVDDEHDFADVIKLRLEANDYVAVMLTNPKDILTAIKKEAPDLILLDIVMPGMDGYQVAKLIRQDMSASVIPIVLLTGKDLEPKETYRKCVDLGIAGFLAKPVESKELLSKIKEVLK